MIPLKDRIPSERPPVTTIAIILANAAAFLRESCLSGGKQEAFLYLLQDVPRLTAAGP